MQVTIKGVHYDISDTTREYLEKKLERVKFAEDLITDLLFTITSKKNGYDAEVSINFRWGASSHIKTDDKTLYPSIDKLFDKLDAKISKEKARKQDHHPAGKEL
jgi:putative sigma-54 modulation protein